MEAKKAELKASVVFLREDGIMHVHIKAGREVQINDAREIVQTIGKLGKKKKYPVLIDCDEFSMVSKEAWEYSESDEANIYTAADAVAYHSLAHKLLADFYAKHNKQNTPTQVFKDNASAIAWLKTFVKDEDRVIV